MIVMKTEMKKIPKGCEECPFWRYEYRDDFQLCGITYFIESIDFDICNNKIHGCPLMDIGDRKE